MKFPSRRSRLLLAIALVAALVSGLFLVGMRNDEPTYESRPFSEWIGTFGFSSGNLATDAEHVLAGRAVRAIGTNALPHLLAWIDHEPDEWRVELRARATKLPGWILNSRPAQRLMVDRDERAANAMKAFEVLGPLASPAIPELHRVAGLTNAPETGTRALIALGYIGPAAMPAITNLLSDTRFAGNWVMPFCLRLLDTNAAPVIPILVNHLKDTNAAVAVNSVEILGVIALRADLAVPALTGALADPRSLVREPAARALSRFGGSARPALPALTNALQDVNVNVRDSARFAIKAITGEL